jgi:hypothetical protein
VPVPRPRPDRRWRGSGCCRPSSAFLKFESYLSPHRACPPGVDAWLHQMLQRAPRLRGSYQSFESLGTASAPRAVVLACGSGGAHRRDRALAGMEERAPAKLSAASSVDSELSCPVLVAHQMSASSRFVLPCGTVGKTDALSTFPRGSPPSGFKRRISHL